MSWLKSIMGNNGLDAMQKASELLGFEQFAIMDSIDLTVQMVLASYLNGGVSKEKVISTLEWSLEHKAQFDPSKYDTYKEVLEKFKKELIHDNAQLF